MSEQVRIERTYHHSPAAVFDAWVDVELLSLWFGCDADTLWQIHEWNPVAGGRLHVSMDMAGQVIEMTGEFLVVDRPELIRYRWGGDHTVTAQFTAAPDGCRLVVTHEGLLGEGMSSTLHGGWSASVEQLAATLRSRI